MEWKNAPRQLPEPATAGKASEALAAAAFCAADGVKVLAGGTVMTPAAKSMPSCAIAVHALRGLALHHVRVTPATSSI